MSAPLNQRPSHQNPRRQDDLRGYPLLALAGLLCVGVLLSARVAATQSMQQAVSVDAPLPNDPSMPLARGSSTRNESPAEPRQDILQEQTASLHEKYIPAGYKVLPLPPHDKLLLGLQDLYAPHTFISIAVSSSYSDLRNGPPNYGSDRNAFARRVGAAALRDTSGDILTDGVFAPLLHEDPRYYIVGPGHNALHRAIYAITRPLVTRTDSGRPSINGALLLGNATASILTNAYYPAINRNVTDTVETFAGSLGGAATGFFITEFTSDLLQALHLQHPQ